MGSSGELVRRVESLFVWLERIRRHLLMGPFWFGNLRKLRVWLVVREWGFVIGRRLYAYVIPCKAVYKALAIMTIMEIYGVHTG